MSNCDNCSNKIKPLVIINGLGAPSIAPKLFGRFFRSANVKIFTVSLPYLGYGDLRKGVEVVQGEVARALRTTGADKVDLIGLSLGGLIGLYYIRCSGGAPFVDRFVSLGGPLKGSPFAFLSVLPLLSKVPVLRQLRPDGEIIQEIQKSPIPGGVTLYSVGAKGDVLTPPGYRNASNFEVVEVPNGVFPLGHWYIFVCPTNIRKVVELLYA